MKITVYTIAKNEEKFALRWYESMKEADYVIVLDTGSTDRTVELLRGAGATVESANIEPWRFDVARNRSLELVPGDTDVCVCTDLDEVFEPGWRKALESAWTERTERGRYRYIWSHVGTRPGVEFLIEKVHRRFGFVWVGAVHEVVVPIGGNCVTTDINMTLHHYPDPKKSRASYLPLLELAVKEDPKGDRNMHYLGREYMFAGRDREAITTLKRHLAMPSATWADERAASMRYIARCSLRLGRPDEAERWLLRAVAEAPDVREPCVELARFYYSRKNWFGTALFAQKALQITERSASYINEPDAWGPLPYDLLSIALYYLADYDGALKNVTEALKFGDDVSRLENNKKLFEQKLSENHPSG